GQRADEGGPRHVVGPADLTAVRRRLERRNVRGAAATSHGHQAGAGHPQDAPAWSAHAGILPRVMVDPAVGGDEAADAALVEVVEGIEPRPGGEHDSRLQSRVGGEDALVVVYRHDVLLLGPHVWTALLPPQLAHHP